MATTTSNLGLTKPAYTDAADVGVLNSNFDVLDREVVKRTNVHNLLDNSDFSALRFITQASLNGKHGNNSYIGDRWMNIGALAAEQQAYGLKLTSIDQYKYMRQCVLVEIGKSYTLAAKFSNVSNLASIAVTPRSSATSYVRSTTTDGVVCISFTATEDAVHVLVYPGFVSGGGNAVIEWAALLEGTYTAETVPAYKYKGYAAELAECMRYFERLPLNLMVDNTNRIIIMDRTRILKRIYPTTMAIETRASETGAVVSFWDANGDYIHGDIAFTTTGNHYWYGYLDISADL